MALVFDDDVVIEASTEDLRAALRSALSQSGFTFGQLANQASTGRFESLKARLAWNAIGNLGDLAPK